MSDPEIFMDIECTKGTGWPTPLDGAAREQVGQATGRKSGGPPIGLGAFDQLVLAPGAFTIRQRIVCRTWAAICAVFVVESY